MRRITRQRRLTPEEAAKYNTVREQVAAELPDLVARHYERMATLDQLNHVGSFKEYPKRVEPIPPASQAGVPTAYTTDTIFSERRGDQSGLRPIGAQTRKGVKLSRLPTGSRRGHGSVWLPDWSRVALPFCQ